MGRHVRERTLPVARPAAATAQEPSCPRHRRPLTDDRRERGIRTARVTKIMVAATFVTVFVCTPEVISAMTRGFTIVFTGQGIDDVAPAQVPPPDSPPDSQPDSQP